MSHERFDVETSGKTRSVTGAYSFVVDRRERLSREGKSFSDYPPEPAGEGLQQSVKPTGARVRQGRVSVREAVPRERTKLDSSAEVLGVEEDWFPDDEMPTGITIREACEACCEQIDEATERAARAKLQGQ